MKTGYDQFFKNARKAATGEAPRVKRSSPAKTGSKQTTFEMNAGPRFELTAEQLEQHLRKKAGIKAKRRRRSFPWGLTLVSILGVAVTGWAMFNADRVEKAAKNFEIAWMGEASANEAAPSTSEKKTEDTKTAPVEASAKPHEMSQVEVDHLSRLNERKKELDAREAEIARQENELAKQKDELEHRLKDLEGMRAKISEMLADRVKTDETKLDTLVQMYSNMKPQQAAKIFETMDEDLAVEILGRMKKKNAADLMNLLKAEKAQIFSEKYAGYKRLPASSK